MTKPINMTVYQCEKCQKTYDTIEEADKCEKSHFDPKHFKIVGIGDEPNTVNEWPSTFYIRSEMLGTTALYQYYGTSRSLLLSKKDK